jgi:hypothetical protein
VPRLAYRLFRHPLVMFGVGPIFALVVQPRVVPRSARPRIKRSVIATNLALVARVGTLCWLIGWRHYLLVQLPTIMLAGAAGIWLFYVQHQFEDVYWESGERWSYADAALLGSSYLKLPKVLQFFSGNIGLHHVHHLSARIPNYNLQRARDENPIFHSVPTLSLMDGMRAVRLKLYDEDRGRMDSRLACWRSGLMRMTSQARWQRSSAVMSQAPGSSCQHGPGRPSGWQSLPSAPRHGDRSRGGATARFAQCSGRAPNRRGHQQNPEERPLSARRDGAAPGAARPAHVVLAHSCAERRPCMDLPTGFARPLPLRRSWAPQTPARS